MRIRIETRTGIITSREFKKETYNQAKNIMRKELCKAGWEEVVEITNISQFKILPEEK